MPYPILIIEDDAATRANLQDILELDGYSIRGVGTLREATEGPTLSNYPLILLDRMLPDGNADAFLQHIQQAAP